MQNVSNLLCPFFLDDGTPISGGRVHFVKPDCSAAPTEGTDPDYVPVYDTDGTEIENPLQLNDAGRFVIQPFVGDGTDYRMIVEAPTGVPATLESESPAWRTVYIIDSKASKVTVEYSGVAVVGGLGELRRTDPAAKSVMVLGYDVAGDFCPPRVFVWKEELLDENYGTHVRSTLPGHSGGGTWELGVSKTVDVRLFGVNPSSSTDCAERMGFITDSHPNEGVYFPAGTYALSKSIRLYSAILERGAAVVPMSRSVDFVVDSFFENRGGRFGRSSGHSAVPCLPQGSTLRTSWLDGDLAGFLTEKSLGRLSAIVFDSVCENSGDIAVSGKEIAFEADSVLSGVTFSNCVIRDPRGDGELNVKLSGNGVAVGKTDFGGKKSELDDGGLDFSTPGGGSASYGLSSMKLVSPRTKTEILPGSVTSDNGFFKNLKCSKTAQFEGSQTFKGSQSMESVEVTESFESSNKTILNGEGLAINGLVPGNVDFTEVGVEKEFATGVGILGSSGLCGLRLRIAKASEMRNEMKTTYDGGKPIYEKRIGCPSGESTAPVGTVVAIYDDIEWPSSGILHRVRIYGLDSGGGFDVAMYSEAFVKDYNKLYILTRVPADSLKWCGTSMWKEG